MDALTSLEGNVEEITNLLASPELAGELGLTQPIAGEMAQEEVQEQVTQSLSEFKSEIESAEGQPEMILRWCELMDSYYGLDVDLKEEDKESAVPNSLVANLGRSRYFLETLGEVSEYQFYGSTVDFAEDLERQRMLQETSTVLLWHFLQRIEDTVVYMNTFMTQIPQMAEEVVNLAESDDTDVSELVEVYRRSGTYYEHALPPILSIISYLEEGKPRVEKNSSTKLSNSIEQVKSFAPLREFVEPFNPNIRNAVSHGGRSGYSANQVNDTIKFRYGTESTKTMEMPFEEFKQRTIRAAAGSIALFVLPFYFVLLYSYVEIERRIES